ncbi:MAG TPA: hypothetical protein VFI02_13830, partial [Armatimonadota bacterium]|nr:hypothetical protein [Armatimonadota bacterium]
MGEWIAALRRRWSPAREGLSHTANHPGGLGERIAAPCRLLRHGWLLPARDYGMLHCSINRIQLGPIRTKSE